MNFFYKLLIYLILAVCSLEISACGKVSSPVPIENSGYPHSYPRR